MATRTQTTETEKWEKIWSTYIAALQVLDRPIKGANARMAHARLAKAENAIRKYDPRAYEKYVMGR